MSKIVKISKIKFDKDYESDSCHSDEETNDLETRQNEEFLEIQNKIGLMCDCRLNTILQNVKKEGPNKGRQFYACKNTYEKKCNYFMWKNESDKMAKKYGMMKTENNEESEENKEENKENKESEESEESEENKESEESEGNKEENKESEESEGNNEGNEKNNKEEFEIDYKFKQKIGLICYCKLPSVLREVKKEGPNKGKMFYTCSQYYDDNCKYFVWK